MVKARRLCKAFGDLTAVGGIDFHIQPGEVFGFLGPNGAGKTTTMKMIYAMVKPDSGTLEINGTDVVKNPRQAKRQLGVVPQSAETHWQHRVGRCRGLALRWRCLR